MNFVTNPITQFLFFEIVKNLIKHCLVNNIFDFDDIKIKNCWTLIIIYYLIASWTEHENNFHTTYFPSKLFPLAACHGQSQWNISLFFSNFNACGRNIQEISKQYHNYKLRRLSQMYFCQKNSICTLYFIMTRWQDDSVKYNIILISLAVDPQNSW